MTWTFEQFKDDGAIYAFCPKCNFCYSTTKGFPGGTIDFLYNYCPMCGEHLENYGEDCEVIWNERNRYEV